MNLNEDPPNVDKGLEVAASELGLSLSGEPRYGWHRKSVGSCVKGANGEHWLRVQYRPLDAAPDKLWSGASDASTVTGVNKPNVLSSSEWEDDRWRWRADIMSLISFAVCSQTPEIRTPLSLSDDWYKGLRTSLENLAKHDTERVNTRQDLITRRISERFGSHIDTQVQSWTTLHGDIHWANLTQPDCWILDWECWGRGPFGLDAAFLLCFSMLRPEITRKVMETFNDWLMETDDGVRAQLFVCAELLRMAELYGDHRDLAVHLLEHAEHLLSVAPLV